MKFVRFGPQRLAAISILIFALILSDCATQSSPGAFAPNSQVISTKQKTFYYTGARQFFTVPAGVTKITITADGASGANIGEYAGGRGGLVTATVPATPDESLAVVVGGSGSDGGFNGGGTSVGSSSYPGANGGGESDVRVDATGRRIVVAGGGGGAGAPSGSNYYCSGFYCSPNPAPSMSSQNGSGGNGGGSEAANGRPGSTGPYETRAGHGGDGGTQSSGGNGGRGGGGSGSCSGTAGHAGIRHTGGSAGGGCYAGWGGGGGGGYYGGGGCGCH